MKRDFAFKASTLLLAGTLGGMLLTQAACSKSGPDIKIGVIAELTGDIPAVGDSCKKAAELAVAEINEAGGVKVAGTKHLLRLVIEDSQGAAQPAAEAAKRLIEQEQVLVILGPNASLGAVPAAQAAAEGSTLLVSPWATAPRVTQDDTGAPRKWAYRVCFTDPVQEKALAKFAAGYVKATKIAIFYNPASEAPKGQAELMKKEFEARSGQVVAFETYAKGDTDFSTQMKKIAEAAPDVVFLPSYYSEVPEQIRQARAAGVKAPFLGSDNWGNPELLKNAAEVEGAFFSAHYNPNAMEDKVGIFRAAFERRYSKEVPDDIAALTYDTMGLLKQALQTATGNNRDAVREAFSKITSFDGVTGKILFKGGSPDPVKSVVLKQFTGGKATFVTNIDPD
ncbi:MAG: ABC transporter substrate-binding protein [Holophagales bacterium]|jgi:branched-chain amino acid transport system substrate-binding protein|nr:ABC transporter substrate-binding protein [Holophagales bacterium]MBK9964629.1 ABC transporter substrate-binding protein [Holophagales bacterium]